MVSLMQQDQRSAAPDRRANRLRNWALFTALATGAVIAVIVSTATQTPFVYGGL
jgi:hypothetical protein